MKSIVFRRIQKENFGLLTNVAKKKLYSLIENSNIDAESKKLLSKSEADDKFILHYSENENLFIANSTEYYDFWTCEIPKKNNKNVNNYLKYLLGNASILGQKYTHRNFIKGGNFVKRENPLSVKDYDC